MYWAKLMAALLATRGMELENVVHVGSSTCPLKDIVREVAAHQRHRLLMILCVETRSKRGAQANEPQRRTVWSRTRWRQSGNNHISFCLYFLLSIDIFLKPTFVLFSSRSRARHVGQDWHRKESCICTDDHDVHLIPFWYPDQQFWTIGKLRGGAHGFLPNRNEYRRYWYPSGIWRFLLKPIGYNLILISILIS